jgi:hypothetical protein
MSELECRQTGGGSVRIEHAVDTLAASRGTVNADLRFSSFGDQPVSILDPWDSQPFVHCHLREYTTREVPYTANPNAANTGLTQAAFTSDRTWFRRRSPV